MNEEQYKEKSIFHAALHLFLTMKNGDEKMKNIEKLEDLMPKDHKCKFVSIETKDNRFEINFDQFYIGVRFVRIMFKYADDEIFIELIPIEQIQSIKFREWESSE